MMVASSSPVETETLASGSQRTPLSFRRTETRPLTYVAAASTSISSTGREHTLLFTLPCHHGVGTDLHPGSQQN